MTHYAIFPTHTVKNPMFGDFLTYAVHTALSTFVVSTALRLPILYKLLPTSDQDPVETYMLSVPTIISRREQIPPGPVGSNDSIFPVVANFVEDLEDPPRHPTLYTARPI